MQCRIGLAQIDPVLGELEKNIALHVAAARTAMEKGVQLIVFPELSLTGYSLKDLNWDVAISVRRMREKIFSELHTLSKEITIIDGGVEESQEFGLFNSAFLFEDGNVRSIHRKIYLPTYGMFEESRYFSAGNQVRSFQSKIGTLGVLICEDMWHPALPYMLATDGAQLIISLTASPTRLSGQTSLLHNEQVNHSHHAAYARLFSAYIAFCNRVGFEDGVNFWGGSAVFDPFGNCVTAGKHFDSDLVIADIDDALIRRSRRSSRHFLDDSPEFTLKQLQHIIERRSS